MTNTSLKIKKYLLFIGDIFFLYFSLWLTLLIRYQSEYTANLWNKHLLPFSIVFIIWLIIFYIAGLYEFNFTKGRMNLVNSLSINLLISGVIAVAFFYFGHNRLFTIKPQKVLLIDILITIIFLYLWRQLFYRFSKSPKLALNLLIIGFNQLAQEVINETNNSPQLGFKVKALLINQKEQIDIKNSLQDIYTFNEIDELKNICLKYNINGIISATDFRQNLQLSDNLFRCLPLKIDFSDISNFYEKITGKVPVNSIQRIWFLENLSERSKHLYDLVKRLSDIIISLVLLLGSLLFLPIIILVIKTDSPGPFLFKQIRVGKNKKKFMAMKFRTMKVDAEKDGPQWAQANDPRITKVGKFLRKSRIDEIPQLINVLRGEMSLIGPRPERPEFVETLKEKIPFYEERLLVKPGLTGWAQVMGPAYGGSEKESLQKLQYDLFYIKNRSFSLDLSILLKTIKIVISGKGQ